MPLVSIVMATFNGAKYIAEQIDSILAQSYSNIELIIVDDCSSDGTLKILNQYAELDSRIQVYSSQKNSGVVATFERALGLANGELIALSDQDDIFRRDKIAILASVLEAQPDRDLVMSDLNVIDEQGLELASSLWEYQNLRPKEGKPFKKIAYRNFATGCAMMFRRRLLSFVLPFPQNIHMHDWWIALVSTSSQFGGICLIKDTLTSYRQHGGNVLGAQKVQHIRLKSVVNRITKALSLSGDKRYKVNQLDVLRLDGYFKKDIWSSREKDILEEIRSLNQGYVNDMYDNFICRISRLPGRLLYSLTFDNAWSVGRVILITVWPPK